MPDLFGNNPQKIIVKEEIPDSVILLEEENMDIVLTGEGGIIQTELNVEDMCTTGEGIILRDLFSSHEFKTSCCNVLDYGVISDPDIDQTDVLRVIFESGNKCIYIPSGIYRCRNLYVQDNQHIIIDGTIKQIDGTAFDITQDAAEGQPTVYIENATAVQMDFLEALCNEAPNYYYYVTYWDDSYTIEGGGTGQVHHNAWTSRMVSVNKAAKTITMGDNIPTMPNYCGGALHVVDNPKITVYYNILELDAILNPKISGSGTLDANRDMYLDANPVWISGQVGHPEFEGSGANFIECINCRFGDGVYVRDIRLQNGKDNFMMWFMTGYIHVNGISAYNAHNKNIAYLVSGIPDYAPTALLENCFVDGSDYEDGMLGYANADNCTYLNNVVWNCPRNGYTFNRQNSTGNYADNNDAYVCGVGFSFNRGGITELLIVKNSYVEGGGRHTKDLTYQPAVQIRSSLAAKCGYIKMINVGIICGLHTYAFQIMKAEEIEIVWEPTCANKYKLVKGKFSLPHSYGYFLLVDGLSSNIVLDGGGVCIVEDFTKLFWIKTGATGVVVKNFQFNNYLSIGTIDGDIVFQDNYFNGVFYATGYPVGGGASVIMMLSLDAALGVVESEGDVSEWDDQSDQANNATQATTDLMPYLMESAVNDLPAIKGDGSNDIMNLVSDVMISGDFSIFAVIGEAISPQYMLGYSSYIHWRITGYTLVWKNSTSHTFDHSNVPLDTGYFLHRLTRVSGSVRSYRDTIESVTGPLSNAVSMYINKLFSYGADYGIGAIAELRVYAGTLTEDEIADIENALMLKYDLEIPEVIPPIIGLITHLDASLDVTESGGDVSAWGDQSDAGNDATQATTSLQPNFLADQVNGLPVIYGDKIDDIMNLDGIAMCYDDFLVIAVIGGTTDPAFMFGHSSTHYFRFTITGLVWRCGETYHFDHFNKELTTGYFIHHIRRVSGLVRSYRNNVESTTGAISAPYQMAISKIFSYGSSFGGGSLAELRIYNVSMSDEDLATLLSDLATKFGITLG